MCSNCETKFIARTYHRDIQRWDYKCPVCKQYPNGSKNYAAFTMYYKPVKEERPAQWEEVLDASLRDYVQWLEKMEKKRRDV